MKEREKLSKLHLITSADELHDALSEIDGEAITAKKKMEKKPTLLREQINIRKKIMNQNTPDSNRRQRPLRDIIDELSDFINENEVQMPESLVGKKNTSQV